MSVWTDLRDLKWMDWLYMVIGAAISAASSSVVTVLTANPIATLFGAPQFTPRQLMVFTGWSALSAALIAVGGILKKSPLPDREQRRAIDIAVLPGIRNAGEVDTVMKETNPGTVVSADVAAAILGKPAPPPYIPADSAPKP